MYSYNIIWDWPHYDTKLGQFEINKLQYFAIGNTIQIKL